MSWFQEMAVRAAAQDNPKLMPTPEACELFMGFPKGWTDLGSGGAEAGAYVKILRGVQGIPDCKQRLKAMGKAVVPLIPMFLGWFIQHHESQAAAMRDSSMLSGGTFPACVISNAGIQEFKEVGMNDDSPASGVGHSQSSECSMQAGTEGEAPALVSASRETLEGDSVPQPSNAALNNPDPTGMSAGVDSKSTEPQGNKNWGIDVIADAVAYLRSYLSFPDDRYFLPLALFAALEHCWDECFDEVPYLSVGAAVKSAGKTRVLELLSFLAGEERAVLVDGSITEAALYTEIAEGKTILIDESERLRTPRSPLRPILNGGLPPWPVRVPEGWRPQREVLHLLPEGLQPSRGCLRLAPGPLPARADAEDDGRQPQGVLPCRRPAGGERHLRAAARGPLRTGR